MFKRGLIIGLFLIVGQMAFCDEVKQASVHTYELSFEQAYELMFANNNALKASHEEVEVKRHEKNAAIGHFFPKVGLNTTYLHFGEDIALTANLPKPLGSQSLTLQNENLWFASAGAVWNVFTGGKILALNSAARAKLAGANQKHRQIANELTVELVKRYYGLRFAKDVCVVRKQVYDGIKKHLEYAILLEKAGIIPKSERLHAEVAFANAQRELSAANRDVAVIEEGLKTLIKDETVNLDGVSINPSSQLFVYKDEIPKLEELKKTAMENNPQLKQIEAKTEVVKAHYRSEVANYSPMVSLFAYDIFTQSNLSHGIPRFAVGASANWLLFDGLTRENNIKAASSMKKQVAYETIDAQNNIESLVVKQYQELYKYQEQYESTNTSIDNAKEALRVTELGFKEGISSSLSVIDAQMALSKVKIERLNAVYNYDLTLTDLLKTTGKSDDIFTYINNSRKEGL